MSRHNVRTEMPSRPASSSPDQCLRDCRTVTHLNFRGDAQAALELYHSVFGGAITVVTYGHVGAADDPSEAVQVMWGQVVADNGFHVMAYDVPSRLPYGAGEQAFFVSFSGMPPRR
jgi:PhnB protein